MERPSFDRFFRSAPPDVDVEAIRREWLALKPPSLQGPGPTYPIADRHLPMPLWARRGFTEDGEQAWQTLVRDVPGIPASRPFCVYVHIPFCSTRCAFCDCYSFKLGSHRKEHVERYVDLLGHEIESWTQLGSLVRRPLSTVHLGGGTPTVLGKKPLDRLVALLRDSLAAGPETEWALESSVVDLPSRTVSCLEGLGFRRLHVGVQSLENSVRARIGRRASAEEALDRLAEAITMGWTVSVDLIYGLPGQTLEGVMQDIRTLADLGVHGFSMYELQRSRRNRRFIQVSGLGHQDRTERYWMAQACSQLLTSLDYQKTLFNHFAGHRDTNLYFTFPARGEDLLALGAISDGSFGDYHYRHPQYAAYCRVAGEHPPGLQGGLRGSRVENRLLPLTTALLSGTVPVSLLSELAHPHLVQRWRDSMLLDSGPGAENLYLTGNGSWFVGNMISDLLDSTLEAGGDGWDDGPSVA